jgi:hypothetical protein
VVRRGADALFRCGAPAFAGRHCAESTRAAAQSAVLSAVPGQGQRPPCLMRAKRPEPCESAAERGSSSGDYALFRRGDQMCWHNDLGRGPWRDGGEVTGGGLALTRGATTRSSCPVRAQSFGSDQSQDRIRLRCVSQFPIGRPRDTGRKGQTNGCWSVQNYRRIARRWPSRVPCRSP